MHRRGFLIAAALAIGAAGAAATGGLSAGVATIVAGAEIYTIVDIIGDLLKAVGDLDLIVGGVEAAQNEFGSLPGGQQVPICPQ